LANRKITNFDELFELVNQIDRKYYIQPNSPVIVTANTIKSTLTSIPSIQSISKKAIIKKLLNNKD
jgi:23S rRNA G2445 N2-methylase RlmL